MPLGPNETSALTYRIDRVAEGYRLTVPTRGGERFEIVVNPELAGMPLPDRWAPPPTVVADLRVIEAGRFGNAELCWGELGREWRALVGTSSKSDVAAVWCEAVAELRRVAKLPEANYDEIELQTSAPLSHSITLDPHRIAIERWLPLLGAAFVVPAMAGHLLSPAFREGHFLLIICGIVGLAGLLAWSVLQTQPNRLRLESGRIDLMPLAGKRPLASMPLAEIRGVAVEYFGASHHTAGHTLLIFDLAGHRPRWVGTPFGIFRGIEDEQIVRRLNAFIQSHQAAAAIDANSDGFRTTRPSL